MSDDGTALRFLLTGDEGEPFRPTRCWVKREPGIHLTDWTVHLTRPEGDAIAINDLKKWVLFSNETQRFFDASTKAALFRRIGREEVLEKYIQAVWQGLPSDLERGPAWCLIPSVGDRDRRKRYSAVIERALPGVRILHEPEMVLEYFRLVRRELTLEEGKSSLYLVVDAGASTTNLAFILTRKDRKVVDAVTDRARKGSLRSKHGEAADSAGRWIDEELARLLGQSDLIRGLPPPQKDEALRAIEAAKIEASGVGGADVLSPHLPPRLHISRRELSRSAANLWSRLTGFYRVMTQQLLSDFVSGADADYFRERMTAHGVVDETGVQHLIDGVILAGGTSQLPGFVESMLDQIFDHNRGVRIHRVGAEYSIAAATGAIAHVLHQKHQPSRLHVGDGVDREDNLAAAAFNATPSTNVYFAWRVGDEREQKTLALDRDDPLVQRGGTKVIDGLPGFAAGTKLDARLLPGDEYSRVGKAPQEILVKSSPAEMNLRWDPDLQEASVESPDVRGTAQLRLVLAHLWPEVRPVVVERDPTVRLWSDGAPDIILDLGMSKTVVVTAGAGPFKTPFAAELPAEVTRTPTQAEMTPSIVEAPLAPAALAAPLVPRTILIPREAILEVARAQRIPARVIHEPGEIAEFGQRLMTALAPLHEANLKVTAADLTMLVLSLCVRPFVLLAGPPGSGKTTLVRLVAKLLGLQESDGTFHEVVVQPHWRTEKSIPPHVRRSWEENREDERRLIFFDEINLARPESYLMPFFRRLDTQGQGGGPILACGTLNIDDASRPPSPKIIDRCLLLEIDAPTSSHASNGARRIGRLQLGSVNWLPGLEQLELVPDQRITETLELMRRRVADGVRQDLLPSHRDDLDLAALVTIHRESRIPETLLSIDDVVDRALAGRILVKLAGAAEQVRHLVDALHEHVAKDNRLWRCRRRLALARKQLDLGFVSPWQ